MVEPKLLLRFPRPRLDMGYILWVLAKEKMQGHRMAVQKGPKNRMRILLDLGLVLVAMTAIAVGVLWMQRPPLKQRRRGWVHRMVVQVLGMELPPAAHRLARKIEPSTLMA